MYKYIKSEWMMLVVGYWVLQSTTEAPVAVADGGKLEQDGQRGAACSFLAPMLPTMGHPQGNCLHPGVKLKRTMPFCNSWFSCHVT